MRDTFYLHVFDAALEDRVGSAIGKLVPAVDHTDGHLGELILHLLDPLQEIIRLHGIAVEGLRADGDGLDDILVALNARLEGFEILLERLLGIRPSVRRRCQQWYGCALFRVRNFPTKHPARP